MSNDEVQKMGVQSLPRDLNEAIKLAERSELLHNSFGATIFDKLLENKGTEWERNRSQVTDYELDTYLPLL
jgi:glutamine synthetase